MIAPTDSVVVFRLLQFITPVGGTGDGLAVIGSHGIHEVLGVLYTGAFKSGVHGQLRQADVSSGTDKLTPASWGIL